MIKKIGPVTWMFDQAPMNFGPGAIESKGEGLLDQLQTLGSSKVEGG